jgi:predicted O-methyltransferase YrrM
MAYRKRTPAAAFSAVFRNLLNPKFYRALGAQTISIDHQFQLEPFKISSINQLTGDAGELHFENAPAVFGQSSFFDLAALCALVRVARPKSIFEFGTYTGNSGRNMLLNAPPDATLTTLDLPPEGRTAVEGLDWEKGIDDRVIAQRLRDSAVAPRVRQIFGDSMKFDPMPYSNSMDFIWVDACHEYEFVKNDTNKSWEMLKPGGTIAWHDLTYTCPGVVQHLREVAQSRTVHRISGTNVAYCRT